MPNLDLLTEEMVTRENSSLKDNHKGSECFYTGYVCWILLKAWQPINLTEYVQTIEIIVALSVLYLIKILKLVKRYAF